MSIQSNAVICGLTPLRLLQRENDKWDYVLAYRCIWENLGVRTMICAVYGLCANLTCSLSNTHHLLKRVWALCCRPLTLDRAPGPDCLL